MQNYSLQACENLIEKYINDFGGQMEEINEGCLGLGKVLLHGATGKKSVLIEEYFINSWSSGHKVTMYNKLPKKYEQILNS